MSRQQRRAEERRLSKQRRRAMLGAMAAMAAGSALIAPPADAADAAKTKAHSIVANWAKQPIALNARAAKGKHRPKKGPAKTTHRAGALAASIVVNSLLDDTTPGNGQCTLREALVNANSDSDTTGGDCAAGQDASDSITFSVTGSIVTGSRLDVLDGVNITGPGAASLTVSGNNNHRVFYLYALNDNVTISNITISGGVTATNEPGGGIASFGTNLTLDHVTVSGNTATNGAGGGVFAVGGGQSLTIQSSTLSGNTASLGGGAYISLYGVISVADSAVTGNNATYGGGLAFYGYGSPSVARTTISGNQAAIAGGIAAQLYGMTLDDVTITSNTAQVGAGGGVINHVLGISITDSHITGNSAPSTGGLFIQKIDGIGGSEQAGKRRARVKPHGVLPPVFDGATIIDTTISGNIATAGDTGGIFFYGGANAIQRSTVSGNMAITTGGGIYLYDGSLLLEDSTVANNGATGANGVGGGIFSYEALDIRHSTISGNSAGQQGGNIYLYNSLAVSTIRNSIVANGVAPADPDIATNGVVNASYSLIETPSPNVVTDATDITGIDPALGPLQDNGGPTETMLPQLASPVVNSGDPAYAPPPATDQRGEPRVAGGRTDMGAVELQAGTIAFGAANYPVSEGGGSAIVTITRTGGSDPVSVGFFTADGTAQQPGDYTATTNFVSFAADENGTKNSNVPIIDDAAVEPTETINLALLGVPAGFQGSPSTATISILDNDNAPVSFSIDNIALAEGNAGTTPFTFTITKTGVTGATTSVQVATSNGTAIAPGDYAAVPLTTITFLPGDTQKQVTVNVVGDTVFEPNETFLVNLSNASGGTIATPAGQGTIGNDDPQTADLSITKTTPSTSAPAGSNLTYTITVTNNGPQAATAATVTDVIPANTTFVSANPSQGSCSGTTTVTCNLGGLTNGGTATVTLVVHVTGPTGTVVNTASVAGSPTDPIGSNNAATTPPVPVTPAAVPTLDELGLIALAALLALGAMVKLRE